MKSKIHKLPLYITFYFSLQLIGSINVCNNREIHTHVIKKTLNASTKSQDEGKDQELKPYYHLTDLEIVCTQLKTLGEL